MKVFIRTARYTLFGIHKRSEEILEQSKVEPVTEKPRRYKSNWLKHVTRMKNRMPKIMEKCRPNGRTRLGRPYKGLLDEAETGLLRPNS
jgi:hypothetical protein